MDPHKIIEAYVLDVMRHIPRAGRNDIGLELHGLLAEMFEARRAGGGDAADTAAALAMLREFGTPEEAAARYCEPGFTIIPARQTGMFAALAIAGIVLQWALSLPAVFAGEPIAGWWFGAGLGALWWPGFMALAALASSWLRHKGYFRNDWKPRQLDPDSIDRRAFSLGLAAFAAGTLVVASLPLLTGVLPERQVAFFAFDPGFLSYRAPLASLLWLGQFILLYSVFSAERWSQAARRLDLGFDLLWAGLIGWWIAGGPIFRFGQTDAVVKSILGLLLLIIVLAMALKIYRQRTRLSIPRTFG